MGLTVEGILSPQPDQFDAYIRTFQAFISDINDFRDAKRWHDTQQGPNNLQFRHVPGAVKTYRNGMLYALKHVRLMVDMIRTITNGPGILPIIRRIVSTRLPEPLEYEATAYHHGVPVLAVEGREFQDAHLFTPTPCRIIFHSTNNGNVLERLFVFLPDYLPPSDESSDPSNDNNDGDNGDGGEGGNDDDDNNKLKPTSIIAGIALTPTRAKRRNSFNESSDSPSKQQQSRLDQRKPSLGAVSPAKQFNLGRPRSSSATKSPAKSPAKNPKSPAKLLKSPSSQRSVKDFCVPIDKTNTHRVNNMAASNAAKLEEIETFKNILRSLMQKVIKITNVMVGEKIEIIKTDIKAEFMKRGPNSAFEDYALEAIGDIFGLTKTGEPQPPKKEPEIPEVNEIEVIEVFPMSKDKKKKVHDLEKKKEIERKGKKSRSTASLLRALLLK